MGFLQESGQSLMKGVFWGMVVFAGLVVLGLLAWVASFAGLSVPFVS